MKLLRFIKDKELPTDESTLEIREASRAILFDEHRSIPILFAQIITFTSCLAVVSILVRVRWTP